MKITRLTTFEVPPRWLFLKIETDDGVAGWGEPVVEGRATTVAACVEELSDYLIGCHPRNIEDLWQVMYRGGFYRGGPILMSAIAGIDQALWDIKGKVSGMSVAQLLGGRVRDRIKIYSWIGGDRLLGKYDPDVPQRVIDTHIHLWDPDRLAYPWLSAGFDELPGRYLPRDFQRDAADVNLIATVHVQAEIDHDLDPVLETEWLDELADAHETPTAIIGYADLRDPALGGVLARHARSPRFRGIRQEAWFDPKSRRADIPRVNLLDDISWARGLRTLAEQALVFELLVWPSQLDQAASILREIPELVVVLEHTGLPYAAPSVADWSQALAGFFSAVPSARLKISALGLSDPTWNPATINPLIYAALDAAGPDRCVLASNYPVERPKMSYGQIWDAFTHAFEDLTQVERDAVFATNAAAIYGLSVPN